MNQIVIAKRIVLMINVHDVSWILIGGTMMTTIDDVNWTNNGVLIDKIITITIIIIDDVSHVC